MKLLLIFRVQIMKDGEIMPEGLIHQLKKEQGVNFKVKLSDSCHRSLVEKGIHETFNNTHSTLNSKDEDRVSDFYNFFIIYYFIELKLIYIKNKFSYFRDNFYFFDISNVLKFFLI